MALEVPNFGAHNKQIWIALLGGALLLGIYLRRRSASIADPTTAPGTTDGGDMPDISGDAGDPYSSGTYTAQGNASVGAQGPAGPAGARGPRGPKGKNGHTANHHHGNNSGGKAGNGGKTHTVKHHPGGGATVVTGTVKSPTTVIR